MLMPCVTRILIALLLRLQTEYGQSMHVHRALETVAYPSLPTTTVASI